MKRTRSFATALLFVVAAWLGIELWRAMQERATLQADLAAKKRELAAVRTELDATTTARAAATKRDSDLAQAEARAKEASDRPAAPKPLDPRIANRAKEMSRRNALNNYAVGLDRLHLSHDVLERAKEIILAQDEAFANARRQPRRPIEEMLAETKRLNEARDAQLTALLGGEAMVELDAAKREEPIDWTIGTDMWDGGAPLSPDQLRALAQAEVQVGIDSLSALWSLPEPADQTPDPHTGLSAKDTALLATTSAFLSQAQQAILQRSLIEENQYRAAMRAFGEKQKKLLGL